MRQSNVKTTCLRRRNFAGKEVVSTPILDFRRKDEDFERMPQPHFVLVDISNTFTKIALSSRNKLGKVFKTPTTSLSEKAIRDILGNKVPLHAVVASVVPAKSALMDKVLPGPVCHVGHTVNLGIGIDYPKPASIGADRLANAVACVEFHGKPSIVVDFGTAVTFDVISAAGDYVGGVIAPGLNAMSDYLHSRTALLPLIKLAQPQRAVGRSTTEAMLAGAVHGYRGLVAEILRQIRREAFPRKKPAVIATGGDASLIGAGLPLFDAIDPLLTLEGLRLIGCRNFE